MEAANSSHISGESEKSKKYDRQLRLWGEEGQNKLERCHVCLINATGLGTEILKSLVLPGIGYFTIVDDGKITEEDVGTKSLQNNDIILENSPIKCFQ